MYLLVITHVDTAFSLGEHWSCISVISQGKTMYLLVITDVDTVFLPGEHWSCISGISQGKTMYLLLIKQCRYCIFSKRAVIIKTRWSKIIQSISESLCSSYKIMVAVNYTSIIGGRAQDLWPYFWLQILWSDGEVANFQRKFHCSNKLLKLDCANWQEQCIVHAGGGRKGGTRIIVLYTCATRETRKKGCVLRLNVIHANCV